MKAVIQGLRYNTEAPRTRLIGNIVCNIGHGAESVTDHQYWEAGLYRTGGGRFFLAGKGGPMTQFGYATGQNAWSGGERIIPLEKEAALEWAEQWLDPDTVAEEFADIVQEA